MTSRQLIATALAVPALLLAGCSDDTTTPAVTPSVETPTQTTPVEGPDEEAATSEAPVDEAEATSAAPDQAGSTGAPREIEGGAEGEAAAAVVKSFFTAMIAADVAVCDHLLSFSDPAKSMKSHTSDYETCRELLPPVLEQDIAPEGGEELAGIIEAMNIYGADVDGDTAVVDADNYSELFAETVGQDPITLRKIDGAWYIDLDHSFQPAQNG